MSIDYYRMRPGQEDEVCALIHGLIADYGTSFQSVLTPEALKSSTGFLNVEVAETNGKIVGICAWAMSFSTWRGVKGIHVNDHFVLGHLKKGDALRNLLLIAARNGAAEGAQFIRTEVDISEEFMESLYSEIGFWVQNRHSLNFLEPKEFKAFISI